MLSKKDYFSLSEDVHYLNCATMSPLPKAVEEAGIKGLLRKSQPQEIFSTDFFNTAEVVRKKFSQLINGTSENEIAIIPSVSYGIAIAVKNILKKGIPPGKNKIVLVGDEFPSDVFGWHELVAESKALKIVTVEAPKSLEKRGEIWNHKLIESINEETFLVCISPTHWADGTKFDLEQISKKTKEFGALLIIDATQHLGAANIDVSKIKPDLLICAAYKWLLGPYGTSLAYFGEYFSDGFPLEQTWIGRKNSQDFRSLIDYQTEYQEGAFRYNMGEFSNFINLPMLEKALDLLLEWNPDNIQAYAKKLGEPYIKRLQASGYWIENEAFRSSHLFGVRLPQNTQIENIQKSLLAEKIFVSYRGDAIRVSINVWNENKDLEIFCRILKENI